MSEFPISRHPIQRHVNLSSCIFLRMTLGAGLMTLLPASMLGAGISRITRTMRQYSGNILFCFGDERNKLTAGVGAVNALRHMRYSSVFLTTMHGYILSISRVENEGR